MEKLKSGVSRLANAATAATNEVAKTSYKLIKGDAADRETVRLVQLTHVSWQDGSLPEPALILGYEEGWQMWTLGHKAPHEVISHRDSSYRIFSPMPWPRSSDTPQDPLYGARPTLAIVSARTSSTDSPAASLPVVQIYSLARHGVVASLPIDREILGVQCNDRVIIVAVSGQLQAYHARTLDHIFTLSTTSIPCPTPLSGREGEGETPLVVAPFALGDRWLAYPTDQMPPAQGSLHRTASECSSGTAPAPPQTWTPTRESVSHLAHSLAAAGTSAVSQLSRQYKSWKQGDGPYNPQEPAAGWVIIKDLCTRTTVAHFTAHSSPLAVLEFDSSGRFLATASTSGSRVKIFMLSAPGKDKEKEGLSPAGQPPVLLCTLRLRSATPGSITSITFSPDNEWVAVGSGRGTVHVFKLSGMLHAVSGSSREGTSEILNPVARVHKETIVPITPALSAAFSALQSAYTHTSTLEPLAVGFVPSSDASSGEHLVPGTVPGAGMTRILQTKLCVVGSDGLMRLFTLKPLCEKSSTLSTDTTQGSGNLSSLPSSCSEEVEGPGVEILKESGRFDICRRLTWPEKEEYLIGQGGGIDTPLVNKEGGKEASLGSECSVWAAQYDTVTHAVPPMVWNGGQFRVSG